MGYAQLLKFPERNVPRFNKQIIPTKNASYRQNTEGVKQAHRYSSK